MRCHFIPQYLLDTLAGAPDTEAAARGRRTMAIDARVRAAVVAPAAAAGAAVGEATVTDPSSWKPVSLSTPDGAAAIAYVEVRAEGANLGVDDLDVGGVERGDEVDRRRAGAARRRQETRVALHLEGEFLERRGVTLDDVGGTALYLLSDLSGGVTGEIHYVDAGYNIVAMPHPDRLRKVGIEDEAAG